jgi:hypothetical protein
MYFEMAFLIFFWDVRRDQWSDHPSPLISDSRASLSSFAVLSTYSGAADEQA